MNVIFYYKLIIVIKFLFLLANILKPDYVKSNNYYLLQYVMLNVFC